MEPLHAALDRALDLTAAEGERWLVAFSGGPDSTALLAALAPLARRRGVALVAVHVDHGLDPGSAGRAERAREIAAALGVPFDRVTLDVSAARKRRESPEAAARRCRYEALERRRRELGGTRVLTAHHADDQTETLLLRIAAGTTIAGLSGVAPTRGALLRPLLDLDSETLRASVPSQIPAPVEDPSNRDPKVPRSRFRHHLLPRLEAVSPGLRTALAALPAAVPPALRRIEQLLSRRVPTHVSPDGSLWLDRADLVALPEALRPFALTALLRRAGVVPAPGPVRLRTALRALSAGRRFELRVGSLRLAGDARKIEAGPREYQVGLVSYTVLLPGEVELRELGLRMRISRTRVASWMCEGRPDRAAFELPAGASTAEVRNRRPGDRIRPLGSSGERKLKQLLIDRKMPREARSRLPLLLVGGRIVWVPGVTIDEDFRLRGAPEVWMAELEPLSAPHAIGNAPAGREVGSSEGEAI